MGGVRCLGLFPKKKSIFFMPSLIAMKMKIDKDEDNIDSPPEAREPGTEFSA